LTSAGWSKRASSRASLTKLFSPSRNVSSWRCDFTTTEFDACARDAIDAGMYSLIATRRPSEWS
jgi:hypothetical protein